MGKQDTETKASVVTRLIRAAKRALRGEEKLWVVFWLWGVALYVGSFITGAVVLFYRQDIPFFDPIIGILGLILVLVYPFMFCIALWRCAFNAKHLWIGYLARIYAVIFLLVIHPKVSFFVMFASAFLLGVG